MASAAALTLTVANQSESLVVHIGALECLIYGALGSVRRLNRDAYVVRAIDRQGGVGYEHTMVTGELMRNIGTAKFIPVVRQTSRPATLPTELNTRLYFDLGPGAEYPTQLQALIRDLHNVQTPIPPLGPNPFQ